MVRLLPLCSVLLLSMLPVISCYGYRQVRVHCMVSPLMGIYCPPLNASGKGVFDESGKTIVYRPKFLARVYRFSGTGDINNRGVDLALQGNFDGAAACFMEVLAGGTLEAAASNNLGVVYDVTGRRDEAFAMYAKACLMEDDNEYFRMNFLSLVDIHHPSGGKK